jgi:hypothetical protein
LRILIILTVLAALVIIIAAFFILILHTPAPAKPNSLSLLSKSLRPAFLALLFSLILGQGVGHEPLSSSGSLLPFSGSISPKLSRRVSLCLAALAFVHLDATVELQKRCDGTTLAQQLKVILFDFLRICELLVNAAGAESRSGATTPHPTRLDVVLTNACDALLLSLFCSSDIPD